MLPQAGLIKNNKIHALIGGANFDSQCYSVR